MLKRMSGVFVPLLLKKKMNGCAPLIPPLDNPVEKKKNKLMKNQ